MRSLLAASLGTLVVAGCASPPEVQPDVTAILDGETIAEDTVLFRGGFPPGRQPDGNSVMLRGTDGWIAFDTGRHEAHARRLLTFAHASGLPVSAIVNSHWHLDHASGNRLLLDTWPRAPVYGSNAVVGALPGFLAESRRQSEAMIARGELEEPMLSDVRGDIATITDAGALLPTETVSRGEQGTIAGRKVYVGLSEHAVTAGDLWLYDPTTRVLLAGDLVTLPVPFLDTACPEGWQDALSVLDATDFTLLVPGHGAPMDRIGFEAWRDAFDGLLACAASDADATTCANRWIGGLGELLPAREHDRARDMLDYYVGDVLRGDDARATRYCPG
ncbi:MAG TPA: MBL fold metallo-hydrolase [Xanthomonadaceae bacterium]|nr:MBL fold metallo-hydrolase [Xanthomonadaceae bacterium]